MLVLKIALGLLGLGIVVFFHELGHFLMARLMKIKVDAFSIGWGNPILKKKIGDTEYRIGMFPIGGYCKMHGDSDYNNEAYVNIQNGIKPEKGSYLAASPAARILVSIGGPLFNLLFAILVLSVIWGIGFEINTLENKIILASEMDSEQIYPADIAGLKTGDRIIEIDGRKVSYYHEIHEIIALNPDKTISIKVNRSGEEIALQVTPSLDKSTGAGKIGVIFWIDLVIESVKEDSPAARAGFLPGDIIKSFNDQPVNNTIDLSKLISEKPDDFIFSVYRDGIYKQIELSNEGLQDELGIIWVTVSYRTPRLSIPAAIVKGVKEGYKTLVVSIKSLRLLFKGIDLTQAVSGPVRITYMMGDMATQGFGQSVGTGLHLFVNFIALISIALCVMNMLPLPILDGGMIILFLVEIIRRKPAHPKAVAIYQTCGMVIIFGLMLLAIFGDVMFFIRR
ncbi:MAG: site-2 protease family protein [Treponema sp.]|nr:site-2 protease family protein [Treponema sp.]